MLQKQGKVFQQAKLAAQRLYKKVNFDGGNLQNYELSSLMQQTYDFLKIPFKPTTNDVKEYNKVLDANGDGSVSLQDLQTMAVSFLCGQGVLSGSSTTAINNHTGLAGQSDSFGASSSYKENSTYLKNDFKTVGNDFSANIGNIGNIGSQYNSNAALKSKQFDYGLGASSASSNYNSANNFASYNDYGTSSKKDFKIDYAINSISDNKDYSSSVYLKNSVSGSNYSAVSGTNDIKYGNNSYNEYSATSYMKKTITGDPYSNDYSDPNFLKNMNSVSSSNTGSFGATSGAYTGYQNSLKKYTPVISDTTDFTTSNYATKNTFSKNSYDLNSSGLNSYGGSSSYGIKNDFASTANYNNPSNQYSFNEQPQISSNAYDYGNNDYSSYNHTNTSAMNGNSSYSNNYGNDVSHNNYEQQEVQESRYTKQAQNYLNITRQLFFKHCNNDTQTITKDKVGSLLTETYAALGRNGYHPNDEDVNVWMKLCDTNGDGHVEQAQYQYFVIRALQRSGVEVNV